MLVIIITLFYCFYNNVAIVLFEKSIYYSRESERGVLVCYIVGTGIPIVVVT